MKLLMENWRGFLKEDIYSSQMRDFIRFAHKAERIEAYKTTGVSDVYESPRLRALYRYIEESGFERLGCGMTRCAFQTENNEVLKIAINQIWDGKRILNLNSVRQNKYEIETLNRPDIEAFPRVEEYDKEEYLWFIVERVNVLSKIYGEREQTRVMSELFPKLYKILDKWREHQINGRLVFDVIFTALFYIKDRRSEGWSYEQHERTKKILDGIIGKISHMDWTLDTQKRNKIHKQRMEDWYNYLNSPDDNFADLRKVIEMTDVKPNDFHMANVGFTDDNQIKVLDIAGV